MQGFAKFMAHGGFDAGHLLSSLVFISLEQTGADASPKSSLMVATRHYFCEGCERTLRARSELRCLIAEKACSGNKTLSSLLNVKMLVIVMGVINMGKGSNWVITPPQGTLIFVPADVTSLQGWAITPRAANGIIINRMMPFVMIEISHSDITSITNP